MISIAHLDVIELQVEDLGVKSSRNFLLHPKERLEREKGAEDLRKNVVIPKADELWVSGLKMLNVCFIPLRLRTICKLFIFLTSTASQDSYYASCQGT